MQKSLLAAVVFTSSVFSVSTSYAQDRIYPFGDPPYRLNLGSTPEIETGCWKWNWQQYQWNNHCPRYVYPKAYMFYGRPMPAVVHTGVRAGQ